MANDKFFRMLDELAATESFSKVTRITDAGAIKQKKLEFVMRFFAFTAFDFDPKYDVEEFIDKYIVELSQDQKRYLEIRRTFIAAFDLLYSVAGKDALRKFDKKAGTFAGQVGQVALEAVAVGVARNIKKIEALATPQQFVLRKIKSFWAEESIKKFSASGVSGTKRLSETVQYEAEYFKP